MASKCFLVANRTVNATKKIPFGITPRTLSGTSWTQEKIIKSPLKTIEIPNSTVHEYIWQNLEKWADRTMAVCGSTGRGYTYSQGYKLSSTFSANLRTKFGVRDGDTVAVMLPNLPEFPLVALGVLGAGAVITSINPIYTAHEVQRQLLLSGAKLVVTLPGTVGIVKNALKMAKLDLPIIIVKTDDTTNPEGTILFSELSGDVHADRSCLKEVRRTAKDVCFLPYSSGTTGVPKGVELTNANLVANMEQINDPVIRPHNDTTATHQDAVMAVLPFFHIYGAEVIMFHSLSQGIKLVTLAKFQPEMFLKALEMYKANSLFAAPPIILMMAAHPAASPRTFQHLEMIINGAAPLAASDAERFLNKTKRKMDIRQGYGLTETSPVVAMTPKGLDNYSCVGLPVPNTELKVVDQNLKALGPNEKGELLVRGPQVMTGYKDNDAANKEAFADGWFRTGDLAVADEQGIVTIADRLKELIKVCGSTGRGYTYSQGYKLSSTFSANLRTKFRVRDGDAVAVMLPNLPEFPLVALGVLGAGAVITSINPIYTAHEVQRQLLLSGAKLVVTLPGTVDIMKNALKMAKLDLPIIVVKTDDTTNPEGTILFSELSGDVHADRSCLKEVRRTAKDVCFLPYSSGTTGVPKGVELTNANLVANMEQINDPVIRPHNDTTATHQDAVMAVLPFFHIYGAEVIMFHSLSQGIKLVTLAKFQPEMFLKALEMYKANSLFAAPPIILMMAAHPAASPKTFQHLEMIINGAAPLAASDAERFLNKAKRKMDIRQGYGLTETSPVVAMTPKGLDNYSCVGLPVPNTELKVVDQNLKALGPNEKGELLVRGPQVMTGYKDNDAANKEAFADGWFRTGDLAVADEQGIVTIADRLKELIKVKGFQVPPAELEAVLRDHPSVADAAVIGIPHKTHGEQPKAFIVLKKGHSALAANICAFVKDRVAEYKRISEVMFVDSLPKSAAGKILRRELKEKYT